MKKIILAIFHESNFKRIFYLMRKNITFKTVFPIQLKIVKKNQYKAQI